MKDSGETSGSSDTLPPQATLGARSAMVMMEENKPRPVEKLPRWWGAICLARGMPFFFALLYFGYPDKGLVAMYSVAMMVLIARIFWRLNRTKLFWAMLAGISGLHGILVAGVHFSNTKVPIILFAIPFVMVDFILVFLAFKFAESQAGKMG